MQETKLTENKCAGLFEPVVMENALKQMFEMQNNLQLRLGMDYSKMTFEERVKWLKENWICLTTEFAETLERLPWKHWKKYSPTQKAGWVDDNQKIETFYELIDMFHFFLNMCLAMGIDYETFVSLYVTKNKENFARQDRGY